MYAVFLQLGPVCSPSVSVIQCFHLVVSLGIAVPNKTSQTTAVHFNITIAVTILKCAICFNFQVRELPFAL